MGYRIAVLGATGAVGREMINVLEEYSIPVDELKLLASARSAGQTVTFCAQYYRRSISGLMRLCIYCQMPLCFECAVVEIVEVEVAQSCLTLCDPMDCIIHGILQARILEWVAYPFSRGSSQPRDRTQVSHIAGGFFTT